MTTSFQTKEDAEKNRAWVLVDAADQPLGRLSSEVASVLRGKNKPTFSPHNDDGDFVVVVNAEKVKLTGNKEADKTYFRHTGYVGGIKEEKAAELRARKPEEMIKRSVKGMLPANSLGRKQLGKLKIYAGENHPHEAQKPAPLNQ